MLGDTSPHQLFKSNECRSLNIDSAALVPSSCLYYSPRALFFANPSDDDSVDQTDGSYGGTVGSHSSRIASSG